MRMARIRDGPNGLRILYMLKEFKEFAVKGNALDLAVGVVIGAAFTAIVSSLVNDIFTPILSLLTGHVDLAKLVLDLPGKAVLRYGAFLSAVFNFLIVAFAVFLLVRQINRFRRSKVLPATKECPHCLNLIHSRATRCPNCTASL